MFNEMFKSIYQKKSTKLFAVNTQQIKRFQA
jgi:hypothetical protein